MLTRNQTFDRNTRLNINTSISTSIYTDTDIGANTNTNANGRTYVDTNTDINYHSSFARIFTARTATIPVDPHNRKWFSATPDEEGFPEGIRSATEWNLDVAVRNIHTGLLSYA